MSDDSMWGIGVSFVIAFVGGVLVGANIVLWGTLIRSDHRPHY